MTINIKSILKDFQYYVKQLKQAVVECKLKNKLEADDRRLEKEISKCSIFDLSIEGYSVLSITLKEKSEKKLMCLVMVSNDLS